MDNNYLTESKLGNILNEYSLVNDWIHDRKVPNSVNSRLRPDYRSESLKTIVEFDGHFHYTKPKQILNDRIKDTEYTGLGYRVIHIPYFIQMTDVILSNILQLDLKFEQQYKHGFISDKCVLPAEYCNLGIKRYNDDLSVYSEYYHDIKKSLILKAENMHRLLVYTE